MTQTYRTFFFNKLHLKENKRYVNKPKPWFYYVKCEHFHFQWFSMPRGTVKQVIYSYHVAIVWPAFNGLALAFHKIRVMPTIWWTFKMKFVWNVRETIGFLQSISTVCAMCIDVQVPMHNYQQNSYECIGNGQSVMVHRCTKSSLESILCHCSGDHGLNFRQNGKKTKISNPI